MSREEIEKTVIEAVADELGLDESELSAQTKLQEDLCADSIDEVEILIALENEYGIRIPDKEIWNTDFVTIGDITNFIENHLNR